MKTTFAERRFIRTLAKARAFLSLGAGFETKFEEHLFRPFSRLHSLDQFEGSGIGLATVDKIISKHGGRLWAEAEPDRGATFFFYVR